MIHPNCAKLLLNANQQLCGLVVQWFGRRTCRSRVHSQPLHCQVRLRKRCSHTFPLSQNCKVGCWRKLRSKHAHRATRWPSVYGLVASAGSWLKATESESSATLSAERRTKDCVFFNQPVLVIVCFLNQPVVVIVDVVFSWSLMRRLLVACCVQICV